MTAACFPHVNRGGEHAIFGKAQRAWRVFDSDARLSARIVAEVPRLQRRALSLVYDRNDADDLVQECLTTALAKKATLQDHERLRGWLLSILTNVVRMFLRSRAKRPSILPIDDFTDSLAIAVPPDDRSAARDLEIAMGKLSREHQQVLLLINVEGLSYREAAEILAVPIGTVTSRLARARHELHALLG